MNTYIVSANDFFSNSVDKNEYLFKLLPDLSVFDLVEGYLVEKEIKINTNPSETEGEINKNDNPSENLFFRPSNTELSLNRFIIRSTSESFTIKGIKENNDEVIVMSSDNKVIYTSFKSGFYYYYVVIDGENYFKEYFFEAFDKFDIGVCF